MLAFGGTSTIWLPTTGHLQPLAACIIIAAIMQTIVERYAENNKIRDTGTVQSVALIGGIYASCIATLIFADGSFSHIFNNLLRWEVLFCLLVVNLLVVVSLPPIGEEVPIEGMIGFLVGNWGRSARSGIVAMNVVVLRSAFPHDGSHYSGLDSSIGLQIIILIAVGCATAFLSLSGAFAWHLTGFSWSRTSAEEEKIYADRKDRDA